MTNKEIIRETIFNDFDLRKNYGCVLERVKQRNENRRKIIVAPVSAAAALLIFAIIAYNGKSGVENSAKEIKSDISPESAQNANVPDNIVFNEYEIGNGIGNDIDARAIPSEVISQFTFLKNLAVPEGYEPCYEAEVFVREDRNDTEYKKLWQYEISYDKFNAEKTDVIGSFGIYFTKEENLLLCMFPNVNSFSKSTVNGYEVNIFKSASSTGIQAFFEYSGYKFYVQSRTLSEDEFVSLLKSILK